MCDSSTLTHMQRQRRRRPLYVVVNAQPAYGPAENPKYRGPMMKRNEKIYLADEIATGKRKVFPLHKSLLPPNVDQPLMDPSVPAPHYD